MLLKHLCIRHPPKIQPVTPHLTVAVTFLFPHLNLSFWLLFPNVVSSMCSNVKKKEEVPFAPIDVARIIELHNFGSNFQSV